MYCFSFIYSVILTICILFPSIKSAERNSPCRTPNGENALCIPVDSCTPIRRALTYLSKEAVEFARQSQCGYDDTPLVCCGSSGRPTTTTTAAPTRATTRTTPRTPPITPKATTTTPRAVPTTPKTIPTTRPPITTTKTKVSASLIPTIIQANPASFFPFASRDQQLLPDYDFCGMHSSNLEASQGKETQIREFPWIVSLKYSTVEGNYGGLRCTGTIINERYILTAADCLNLPGFVLVSVVLGRWNLSSTADCYHESKHRVKCILPVEIPVEEEFAHPEHQRGSSDNNIALLRLKEKILEYDDFIRPICLPPKILPQSSDGTFLDVAGWNMQVTGSQGDIKKKGLVCVIGSRRCEEIDPNFNRTHPNSVCIETVATKSICVDNPGAPVMGLFSRKSEIGEPRWYQEGIAYAGLGCNKIPTISAYTRISKHRDWIDNNMWQ